MECMSFVVGSVSIKNHVYAVKGVVKWSECSLVANLIYFFIGTSKMLMVRQLALLNRFFSSLLAPFLSTRLIFLNVVK